MAELYYCYRCGTWDDWDGNGCEICDRCPDCVSNPEYGTHDNDVDHETGEHKP